MQLKRRQPSRSRDHAPGGQERLSARLAQLREEARRDNHLRYLLDDAHPSGALERRGHRPWLAIGVGAVFLGVAGAVAGVLLSGGGDRGGASASPEATVLPATPTPGAQPVAQPPIASASATVTSRATPTPTPSPAGAPEGAIDAGAVGVAPSSAAPPMTVPATVAVRIVDRFGASRGGALVHAGVDVVARTSPRFTVASACDGRVVAVDRQNGLGDLVVVDCGGNWRTVYANMESIAVQAGQSAISGTELGVTRGPLHFELRWSGAPVDPQLYVDFDFDPAAPTPTPIPDTTPEPTKEPAKTPPPSSSTAPPAGGTPPPPDAPTPAPTSTPPPPTATATPQPPTPAATATATPTRTPRAGRTAP